MPKIYPAKTLLFGEYTIIGGGSALVSPFYKFSGQWGPATNDYDLAPFFSYLKGLDFLNEHLISSAIDANITFSCNIPIGYGLGSSGAITAAAYEKFKIHSTEDVDINTIRNHLAKMESFFHGKSSGLDPLCIFLDKTIHFSNSQYYTIDIPIDLDNFYLLDSHQKRETKILVDRFRNKQSNEGFRTALTHLDTLNVQAITYLLGDNKPQLLSVMAQISSLQFEHFNDMIPEHIRPIWELGLNTGHYFMKLSGAGGGGFFLLYGKKPKLDGIIALSV